MISSPRKAGPFHSRNHRSSASQALIDTMGLPQALQDMSTVDLRLVTDAANEPDMQTFASLEGLDVLELDVEVIVL